MSDSTTASLLGLGRSALLTSQAGLNAVGRNIANASTPGYSRLRTELSTWVGGGVAAIRLAAIRDHLLESRLRGATSEQSAPQARHDMLVRIEDLLQGTDGSRLQDSVSKLFASFSDLASSPNGRTERNTVQSQASSLVSTFHDLANEVAQVRGETETALRDQLQDVNETVAQVAQLNSLIASAVPGSADREALIDQRNQTLRTLSSRIGIEVTESSDAMVQVSLPGGPLLVDSDGVAGTLSLDLSSATTAAIDYVLPGGTGLDVTTLVSSGSVRGLLDTRNDDLPALQNQLDTLAAALVTEVNALHAPGINANGTSNDFFLATGLTAATLSLDPAIAADPGNIAAGATATVGDNTVALAIAGLADRSLVIGGGNPQTFASYISSVSADLGSRSKNAAELADYSEGLVASLDEQRAQVSAVSLDEEGTYMLSFQRSYEAAAKFIRAADEAMQATLSML
ncbi:MAG: flagellar hook-associated protein FlgK [bacterium]